MSTDSSAVLDYLYPGRWAHLLVRLCHPGRPHRHPAAPGPCESSGKAPNEKGYNQEALHRFQANVAKDRLHHLARIACHLDDNRGNVGLVLPPDIYGVDADDLATAAALGQRLPDGAMQATGKGAHFLVSLRLPAGTSVRAGTKMEIGGGIRVDLKVPGQHIVCAPSVHANGTPYAWKTALPPDPDDVPDAPPWLMEALTQAQVEKVESRRECEGPEIPEHERNDSLASLAGAMRRRGMTVPEIEAALQVVNGDRCKPPLTEKEVVKVAESIGRYAPANSVNSVISVGGWEPPVEFDAEVHGPPCPLNALPEEIGKYVENVAAVHQVAPDLVAGIGLGVLSAATARKAEVGIGKTHVEPLNLYLMPTAASGERKAQAIRSMVFPLEDEERRLLEEARAEIAQAAQARSVAEARIKYLQDKAAKEDDPRGREPLTKEASEIQRSLVEVPTEPRLLLDDATPEFVAKALADQGGRIAVVSEEAGSLVSMMAGRFSKDTGPYIDVYLKGYDGGQLRVDRITRRGAVIRRPALTIVVTPQPAILDRLADEEELRGRGLLGRICFILPEGRVGTRLYNHAGINASARDAYVEVIQALLRVPVAPPDAVPLLKLEGAALDVWAEYANAVELAQAEGAALAGIRDWASKQAGRVARIAGLFHLVRHRGQGAPWKHPISVKHVSVACMIGKWLEEHALAAFGLMGADPSERWAKRILRWIRRHHREQFTLRDLHQHHRSVRHPNDLLSGLRVLEARGFIRGQPQAERKGPGRRPSPGFRVNPLTRAQNSQKSQKSARNDRNGHGGRA